MTVTEMMIAVGVPVCVVENRLLGGPPQEKDYPGKRNGVNPLKWMTKEAAAEMMGTTCEKVIILIGKKELRPAFHRGGLFISLDSIEKYIERNAPAVVSESKPKFMPKLLTSTVSKKWTGPVKPPKPVVRMKKEPSDSGQKEVPKIFIKLTQYAPDKWGYEVKDVAIALKRHPDSIRNLVGGYKVEGVWVGDKCYIIPQSLKDWLKRMSDFKKRETR